MEQLTYAEMVSMKETLEKIFMQKVNAKFAFKLLTFLDEYQNELNKLSVLRDKLVKEEPINAEAQFIEFLTTTTCNLNNKLSSSELVDNNIEISTTELLLLRKVLKE
jgi:hypothetical protein